MITVLDVRVLRGCGGGPEKTLARSRRYLQQYGCEAVCAYLCDPRDERAQATIVRLRNEGADVYVIEDYGPWDIRTIYQLRKLVRRIPFDIYHGHDYKSNILAILLGSRYIRVSTLHGWVDDNMKLRWYYWVERRCLRRCARLYCVSHELWHWAVRFGIPRERVRYLPNGIELQEYRRTRDCIGARKELGLPEDGFYLGSVGRMAAEKNYLVLLRSIHQLSRVGFPVRAVLVGEGPQKEQLELKARRLGIANRVIFAGYQNDVRRWLECLDVYVCTSLREGMPNSVLEAMALEVPVIATRVGDLPYLIRDGQEGILLARGTCEEIAAIIKALIRGEVDKQGLAHRARRRVEEKFSFEERMRCLAHDYHNLYSERKSEFVRGVGRR